MTGELPDLVSRYCDQITSTVDANELERLKAEEKRLAARKQEAMWKELYADDADDKRYYAERVAEFKGQIALLRRRIASFTAEADLIEVDTAAIAKAVRAAMRTKDPLVNDANWWWAGFTRSSTPTASRTSSYGCRLTVGAA